MQNKTLTSIKSFFKKVIYKLRYLNEVRIFGKNHNVHQLPEIFHYWSNKYLLPKEQLFGFNNPDEFFYKYCKDYCLQLTDTAQIKIISIGSGNGELEVNIAINLVKSGITNFIIECMDINAKMHARTIKLAESHHVEHYIQTLQKDFNDWQPDKKYDLILANQSLHHVTELEQLFESIYQGLSPQGKFVTSDVIGRNGHMRWPEALEMVQAFWQELSRQYTYNPAYKRYEKKYINHDCSARSFEGIRAQDVLPLLVNKFEFEMFLPFANIIMVFIDRTFGHNFDANNEWDLDFIDRVHAADEAAILNGTIKPTQMLAVMTKPALEKAQKKSTLLLNPKLTPEFCIRNITE